LSNEDADKPLVVRASARIFSASPLSHLPRAKARTTNASPEQPSQPLVVRASTRILSVSLPYRTTHGLKPELPTLSRFAHTFLPKSNREENHHPDRQPGRCRLCKCPCGGVRDASRRCEWSVDQMSEVSRWFVVAASPRVGWDLRRACAPKPWRRSDAAATLGNARVKRSLSVCIRVHP